MLPSLHKLTPLLTISNQALLNLNFSRWIRKDKKQHQKSIEYEPQTLRDLFSKYQGLLALKSKVPIRDQYSLSLTYTPGVGASCKEIVKDNSLVNEYTNKRNSILVMTDSTGFKDYDYKTWNNYVPIPYLESLCLYYKAQVNIDAYPIVLDFRKIKTEDDILEIIVKLAPAYSGYDLFNITNGRLWKLEQKFKALENPPKIVLFTQLERNYIEYKLVAMGFKGQVHASLLISALIRAALDTCSYGIISRELIDLVLEKLKESQNKLSTKDYYYLVYDAVNIAAQYFLQKGLNQDKTATLAKVERKFSEFLIEGTNSWIEPLPTNHFQSRHTLEENSLLLHKRYKGVIELAPKINVKDPRTLDLLLDATQVTSIAEEIKKDPSLAWELTCKRNLCSIITNGTAILGFGDIGNSAGLPVMEGKSCLFKLLGGVDLVPICIDEKDPKKLIDIIEKIHPIFSAINLEDIKAPECFEIERTLIDKFNFPIFHDDQHGTSIVSTAALINSCKLLNKSFEELKVVINGCGAAGYSVADLFLYAGVKNIIVCDTAGILYEGRNENMNQYKEELSKRTNKEKMQGTLSDALQNADVFVGVSAPGILTGEMIKTMKAKPIIFALANPVPEIFPEEAKKAGAYIVCTGRSDYKNQINDSLVFPGIFRGLLDIQAKKMTMELKLEAAQALANIVGTDLNRDYVLPNTLESRVPIEVAKAIAKAGIKLKLNIREINEDLVEDSMKEYFLEGNIRKLRKMAKQLKP